MQFASPHRLHFLKEVLRTKVIYYKGKFWIWELILRLTPLKNMMSKSDVSNLLDVIDIELKLNSASIKYPSKKIYNLKLFYDELNLNMANRKDFILYLSQRFNDSVTNNELDANFVRRIELIISNFYSKFFILITFREGNRFVIDI